ncbi:uncharacterized protein DUF4855 [Tumebacillus sp. BK434]|uniref:DUF4855 domain-containing protein n=1 Tax=Tumebacillus sp. BK434 TaxID=2512169 RepID=UPI0010D73DF4|nr:DUF4855 domain-containing protein [Tumebacillus sp. BK434]TCP55742.1 uncharacterized protein DUF4855 [Tumebacillus sp. BK434]
MKKTATTLALAVAMTLAVPAVTQAAYLTPGTQGLDDLWLTYVGWSPSTSGAKYANQQYWTTTDFEGVLTHLTSSGTADDFMFTDYLFLGLAVKDSAGNLKTLTNASNNTAQGTTISNAADWDTYLDELFAASKNINALYTEAAYNKRGLAVTPDVWIGIPYPHPAVIGSDTNRIANSKAWIDKFITRWNNGNYSSRLNLRGFYWICESEYYNGGSAGNDDGNVMTAVNSYVHSKSVGGKYMKSLWIPYQGANNWTLWSSFGFDAAILQPHYYFDAATSLDKGAYDATTNGAGVEMELGYNITSDSTARSRFIQYLNKGATGNTGTYSYGPYMTQAAIGWYPGGWVWTRDAAGNPLTKSDAIHNLYNSGDNLYNNIYKFVKGSYISGTAY